MKGYVFAWPGWGSDKSYRLAEHWNKPSAITSPPSARRPRRQRNFIAPTPINNTTRQVLSRTVSLLILQVQISLQIQFVHDSFFTDHNVP